MISVDLLDFVLISSSRVDLSRCLCPFLHVSCYVSWKFMERVACVIVEEPLASCTCFHHQLLLCAKRCNSAACKCLVSRPPSRSMSSKASSIRKCKLQKSAQREFELYFNSRFAVPLTISHVKSSFPCMKSSAFSLSYHLDWEETKRCQSKNESQNLMAPFLEDMLF